jgi:pyruvate dehydrogenase (quinone)
MAERAVTCIIVPADIQEMDAVPSPPRAHGSIYSSVGYSAPKVVPVATGLRRAAEVLNAGERVAMLVGAGALHATDEVIEVAEILGAGVAKALLGRAALPDDLPFVTGQIGLLGSRPSYEMMMGCDTLLMVGSSFPYSEFLPPEGQARGVQIDIDGKMLASATRWKCISRATAPRHFVRWRHCWSARPIGRGASNSKRGSRSGGRSSSSAR